VRSRRGGMQYPAWQNRNTLPMDTRARRSRPRIDEEPLHGSRHPRGRQIVVRAQTATIGAIPVGASLKPAAETLQGAANANSTKAVVS